MRKMPQGYGTDKVDGEKKNSKSKPDTKDLEQKLIRQLLASGDLADIKQFQTLLTKIQSGKNLTATESKKYDKLKVKLKKHVGIDEDEDDETVGNGRPPNKISVMNDAADYCGFSVRTLKYHIGRGNIKQNPDGSFDRAILDKFLQQHKGRKKVTADQDPESGDGIYNAEYRYRLARAEREELIVRQLKGELIPVEEVEQMFTDRAYEHARRLLMLSRRIAHKVSDKSKKTLKEVAAIIDKEVYDIMDGYTRPMIRKGKVKKK